MRGVALSVAIAALLTGEEASAAPFVLSKDVADAAVTCSLYVPGPRDLRSTSEILYYLTVAAKAMPGDVSLFDRLAELNAYRSAVGVWSPPRPPSEDDMFVSTEESREPLAACDKRFPRARSLRKVTLPADKDRRDILCLGAAEILRGSGSTAGGPEALSAARLAAARAEYGRRLSPERRKALNLATPETLTQALAAQLLAATEIGNLEGVMSACLQDVPKNAPAPLPSLDGARVATCENKDGKQAPDRVVESCTALLASQGLDDGQSVAILFHRAAAQTLKKDYTAALTDLGDAMTKRPRNALLLRERGRVHALNGDANAALRDVTAAIELEPDHGSYDLRSRIHRTNGRHSEALADLNQAVLLAPEPKLKAEYHNEACWLLAATMNSELDRALRHCDAAISSDPSAEYFDSRGMVALRQKRFQAAWDDYSEAVRLNPKSGGHLFGRAVAASHLGRAEEAARDMAAAALLDEKAAAAYAELGVHPAKPSLPAESAAPSPPPAGSAAATPAERQAKAQEDLGRRAIAGEIVLSNGMLSGSWFIQRPITGVISARGCTTSFSAPVATKTVGVDRAATSFQVSWAAVQDFSAADDYVWIKQAGMRDGEFARFHLVGEAARNAFLDTVETLVTSCAGKAR